MKDMQEFKAKGEKYSNLKNLSGGQYREASKELEPYLKKLDLVKKCFTERIAFTYYLEKPIRLDSYNNRIDEHDEEVNRELDDIIGKADTLGKYSSHGRSEGGHETTPITYSVDMNDRRAITFYFREVEEEFRSCCSALVAKRSQEFMAQIQK